MAEFTKQRLGAPRGFFRAEADGLAWLAEPGVVPVVPVLRVEDHALVLERLDQTRPDARMARAFGEQLAQLHDSTPDADGFGWAPSEKAWFGPLDAPFEVSTRSWDSFGQFWAEGRLEPLLPRVQRALRPEGYAQVEAAVRLIADGRFDGICGQGNERPARVHGDLWSGNVFWTSRGGTLIDPSAHAGHRLEDLAMLSLFGAPHLDQIFAGYQSQHPMPQGWIEDLPAHLFFGLLAHVVLFGGGYGGQSVEVAGQIIERAAQLD